MGPAPETLCFNSQPPEAFPISNFLSPGWERRTICGLMVQIGVPLPANARERTIRFEVDIALKRGSSTCSVGFCNPFLFSLCWLLLL